MTKNISLGSFQPGNSLVHTLDPRVKILFLVCLAITVLGRTSPMVYIGWGIILLLLLIVSRISIWLVIRELKGLLGFLVIIVLLQGLQVWLRPGQAWSGLNYHSYQFIIKISLLSLGTLVVMHTTEPVSLVEGMQRWYTALIKEGKTGRRLFFIMLVVLQFTPFLFQEAQRIKQARQARTPRVSWNPFVKARDLLTMIVPLFTFALGKAGALANAMILRGYTGSPRTRTSLYTLTFRPMDYMLTAVLLGSTVFLFIL